MSFLRYLPTQPSTATGISMSIPPMPYIQIQHERLAYTSLKFVYVEDWVGGQKRFIAKGISANDDAKI